MFLGRVGLARERGLVGEELVRLEDQAVSRNDVSGAEQDDIAWYDLLDRNVARLLVSNDTGLHLHHREQLLDGVRGASFLPEAEQPAGPDDDQDDGRVDGVMEEHGENGRTDQDQDDRALELSHQQGERVRPLAGLQEIRTVTEQTAPGFCLGQPLSSGPQLDEEVVGALLPEAVRGFMGVVSRDACRHRLASVST